MATEKINGVYHVSNTEQGGGGSDPNAVKYTEQSLTEAQKAQARTNIGAPSTDDMENIQAQELIPVTTLPTASADTMGKQYLVGPDANNEYARYVTSYDGTTYSWVPYGTTALDLSGYATDEELDQLEAKVDEFVKEINNPNYSASDFKVVLWNSTTQQESSSPNRIRLILYLDAPVTVKASCTLGQGITAVLYDSYEKALPALENYVEAISYNYVNSIVGYTTQAGYLTMSLRKSDSSIFTNEEISEYLSAVNISVLVGKDGLVERTENLEKTTIHNELFLGTLVQKGMTASGLKLHRRM